MIDIDYFGVEIVGDYDSLHESCILEQIEMDFNGLGINACEIPDDGGAF